LRIFNKLLHRHL